MIENQWKITQPKLPMAFCMILLIEHQGMWEWGRVPGGLKGG